MCCLICCYRIRSVMSFNFLGLYIFYFMKRHSCRIVTKNFPESNSSAAKKDTYWDKFLLIVLYVNMSRHIIIFFKSNKDKKVNLRFFNCTYISLWLLFTNICNFTAINWRCRIQQLDLVWQYATQLNQVENFQCKQFNCNVDHLQETFLNELTQQF